MLTLVQSWYFALSFSSLPEGVYTCPESECMHWEEEEVKTMKAAGIKHSVTPRKSGPCLHSSLSIQLIAILYARGQERRKVAWIHILSPPLCVPDSCWIQRGWHQELWPSRLLTENLVSYLMETWRGRANIWISTNSSNASKDSPFT